MLENAKTKNRHLHTFHAVKFVDIKTHISKIFQIHQLTIMYRFEHRNHDILQNVLFKIINKLILHECNLHQ